MKHVVDREVALFFRSYFKDKNQSKMFLKLLDYALLSGISKLTITIIDSPFEIEYADIYYDISENRINLELPSHMTKKEFNHYIVAISHELGHYYSILVRPNGYRRLIQLIAEKQYKGKINDKYLNLLLLDEELTAWENAILILKELDLYSFSKKTLDNDAIVCFDSYVNFCLND